MCEDWPSGVQGPSGFLGKGIGYCGPCGESEWHWEWLKHVIVEWEGIFCNTFLYIDLLACRKEPWSMPLYELIDAFGPDHFVRMFACGALPMDPPDHQTSAS